MDLQIRRAVWRADAEAVSYDFALKASKRKDFIICFQPAHWQHRPFSLLLLLAH